MAKELARNVYGNEDKCLFIEMGQFRCEGSLCRLVGAPQGHIGYAQGQLTNGLRDYPECVVLFDEIEKAGRDAFDAMLRFVDQGKVVDPAGPVRDGRRCIVVMTTNAGQKWLQEYVRERPESREHPETLAEQFFEAATQELVAAGFRPEFMGRIDRHIAFLPFSKTTCRQIVDRLLHKELTKIRDVVNAEVLVPDDIRDVLAQSVFDRSMEEGARGASRTIDQVIVNPIVDLLSDIQRGDQLPASLRAVLLDSSDIQGVKIEWEVMP